jgi:hypothetical protein
MSRFRPIRILGCRTAFERARADHGAGKHHAAAISEANHIKLEGVCGACPCNCHFIGERLPCAATLAPARRWGLLARSAPWLAGPACRLALNAPRRLAIRRKMDNARYMAWSLVNEMCDGAARLRRLPAGGRIGSANRTILNSSVSRRPCACEPTRTSWHRVVVRASRGSATFTDKRFKFKVLALKPPDTPPFGASPQAFEASRDCAKRPWMACGHAMLPLFFFDFRFF